MSLAADPATIDEAPQEPSNDPVAETSKRDKRRAKDAARKAQEAKATSSDSPQVRQATQ